MYLDKDLLFVSVQNEQKDVAANSRGERVNGVIQNWLQGFSGKWMHCCGMMLLKIECI